MNIDEDSVTDTAAAFGELFEGQTVSFDNDLEGQVSDDVLGTLAQEMGLGSSAHHNQTGQQHPSEHDILAANLPFVGGNYIQQQHVVLNDGTEYMVPVQGSDVDGIGSHQSHVEDGSQQSQVYMHHHSNLNMEHQPTTDAEGGGDPYTFQEDGMGQQQQDQNQLPPDYDPNQVQQDYNPEQLPPDYNPEQYPSDYNPEQFPTDYNPEQFPPGFHPGIIHVIQEPKIKVKATVVKSLHYFTLEAMDKYMKKRGFKRRNGTSSIPKSISKKVLAATADREITSGGCKLVSFRSRYEPEVVIHEMERFWKFYLSTKRSQNTRVSSELLPMLIPMLFHFYVEMTLTGLFPMARRISFEFSKKFYQEDKNQEYYEILLTLMKVPSAEAIKTDSVFENLVQKKYEFLLSELTIVSLRRFLSKSNHPTLANLFTDCFKIRSRETKELLEKFNWERWEESGESEESDSASESEEDAAGNEDNENADADWVPPSDEDSDTSGHRRGRSAKDVINDLRNSVTANLPTISVYTIGDKPICGTVSRKGTLLAYGLTQGGLRICSVENARDLSTIQSGIESKPTEAEKLGVRSFSGHAGAVYGVGFHPRTRLLFSVGEDSLMRAWSFNTEDIDCKAVYRGHVGTIWDLDVAGSGTLLATAGLDTTARVFIPERSEYVRIMAGHYFSVNTVKFHPNEAYLATGSVDKSVRLWSVNDGKLVRMFTGSLATVNCLAFHESGKYLAGAGEDDKILIWDLAEGEVIASLATMHNCRSISFYGNMLSACFRNGMVQFFNLRPIVGGKSVYDEDRHRHVHVPVNFNCFAQTLFKVDYRSLDSVFVLGSDIVQDERQLPIQDPANPPTDEEIVEMVRFYKRKILEEDADYCPWPNSELYAVTSPEVKSSLGENSSVQVSASGASSGGGTGNEAPMTSSGSANSRILASRLSQPLSISSASGDEAVVSSGQSNVREISSLPSSATVTASKTTTMISSADLDAAIASVIDQSGGDNSGESGGGTITMYASS